MKISVVTPTYDNGRFLRGTIESLLEQTHKDREHIVVDGGSTDSTLDILKEYGDRVQWISEPDRGMYDAINKGLRMATGEVVTYLNSDDRYYPDTLGHVASCFANHPALDFVYGSYTYVWEDERHLVTFRAVPYLPALLKRGGTVWCQPSCFWRKRVHDKVGYFNEGMRAAGDLDFFKRFLWRGLKGKRVARSLSKFMLRPDALSYAMQDGMHEEAWESLAAYGITKDDWAYRLNQALFCAINLDRLFVYIPRYVPLRHGSFRALAKKKLGRNSH